MQLSQSAGWKVLLIGGSSGAGKTMAARQLAKSLSISLLLLDDVRLALQRATSPETHPDLHIFLQYPAEGWRDSDSIYRDWIAVGQAMMEPLKAIISHHLLVPDVGRIIIEGDGILPMVSDLEFDPKDVRTVFILEQEEQQLLENLRRRGRGFHEWAMLEQEGFAHASWLYGQWIAREAETREIPVIPARPQQTLLERLMAAVGKPSPEN